MKDIEDMNDDELLAALGVIMTEEDLQAEWRRRAEKDRARRAKRAEKAKKVKENLPPEFTALVNDPVRLAMNEHNDCSVIATVLATGVSYLEAHAAIRKQGRKHRRGAYSEDVLKAIKELGFKVEQVRTKGIVAALPAPHNKAQRLTTKKIAEYPHVFPEGAYFVFISGHFLCIKDKRVLDWSAHYPRRVKLMYRITKAS